MSILHRNRTVSALMPRFVERFRCIGASCEDTCCSGWSIHIDKKTYKAYRNHTHPALKRVTACVRRVDDSAMPGMYGVLPIVGSENHCPALQDGMCAVQAVAGASYLSDTCDTYPRINRIINGHAEQSMSLSCPEAARLALLAEDAFDFVEAPASVREGTLHPVPAVAGMTQEVMNDIRMLCMNLMRTRELALWQRLALLGALCEALDGHLAAARQGDVPTLLDDFVRAIQEGELIAALEPVQPDYGAQAMVFATLWSSKGFDGPSSFQQRHMTSIAAGLGGDADGQVSADKLVTAYIRGLHRLDSALAEAPWMLEHFVLNEMFSQQFPFSAPRLYDCYLRLVARVGLLRLLLAAQCNTDDDLPAPATLAATVQLQSRRFQHNAGFAAQVNQSLHDSGWATLDRLYTLLRT